MTSVRWLSVSGTWLTKRRILHAISMPLTRRWCQHQHFPNHVWNRINLSLTGNLSISHCSFIRNSDVIATRISNLNFVKLYESDSVFLWAKMYFLWHHHSKTACIFFNIRAPNCLSVSVKISYYMSVKYRKFLLSADGSTARIIITRLCKLNEVIIRKLWHTLC